jgi:hypothetical protein
VAKELIVFLTTDDTDFTDLHGSLSVIIRLICVINVPSKFIFTQIPADQNADVLRNHFAFFAHTSRSLRLKNM